MARRTNNYLALGYLLLAAAVISTTSAECTRESLMAGTREYMLAQGMGMTGHLTLLAENVTYLENDRPTDLGSGILTEGLNLDFVRSIYDTTGCATFTEIISASSVVPHVIGTRMLFNSNGTVITTIDSIVTHKGDWAFNATGYLYWNSIESWEPIPKEKRDSRAVIQAAGDAYFNRFNNVSVNVPFGTPCARLEGGAYTGRGNLTANSCTIGGLPSTIKVTNRRYVVDEEMGVVVIFLGFPGLDRTRGQEPMPDSHMFRVEGGKIKYIHTVSACVTAGCGMNGTGPPL